MPRTNNLRLTPCGKRLYWIARGKTHGQEMTIHEFFREYVDKSSWFMGDCWGCGQYRKIVGSQGFCVPCASGAIES